MPGTRHTSRGKSSPKAASRRGATPAVTPDAISRKALDLELGDLRAEVEALRTAAALKDQYLSVATHELSAPLAAMKAYLEALLEHHEDPGFSHTGEFLQVLGKETDRMIRLVERTLEISRLTSRGVRIEREDVALAQLVLEIVPALRPILEERAISLDVDFPPEIPPVYADRDLVKQVLVNLVHNAVKFSPRGRRVTIRATPRPDEVEIEVLDQGIGIASEEMEHLFEPYFRSSDERAESQRGTGLGLSIVKTIVEQHGGTVGVESRPEHGTTFRFTLPRV